MIDRRQLLIGSGAAGLAGLCARSEPAMLQSPFDRTAVSVADFNTPRSDAAAATRAIQAAVDFLESKGGGTLVIPGRYRCGNIVVKRGNVRLQGQDGWFVDGRLTIARQASNVEVDGLGIVDTRGDNRTYLADISGSNCRFTNFQLVKDPAAGGYQMYLRQTAQGCSFSGLKLRGSNGIMVAGQNHLFEDFDLQSTMSKEFGGDDAFAIKAIDATSENITIRNGVVRGYVAIASLGSEIGTSKVGGAPGVLRNVTVENVTGDRCTSVAFFKPGALIYDYRNGLIEHVVLKNLTLNDLKGEYFRSGIYMLAGRGATIRDVQASGIRITARAMDRGVAPTSAVDIYLLDRGAPATIRDVTLQLQFEDPYAGASHSASRPGYPVDYIAHIEKEDPAKGSVAGIVLQLDGRGSGIGGISVGAGMDGAVTLKQARLTQVGASPPHGISGFGIWSNSRLNLGDVRVEPVHGPKFGGRAFPPRRG